MDNAIYQPLGLEHLDGLVDVHYRISTEHNLLPLIGRSAVKAFYRWWVDNPRVVALVACCGKSVVGHALGPLDPLTYRGEMNRAIAPKLLPGLVRAATLRPLQFARLIYARRTALHSAACSVLRLDKLEGAKHLPGSISYSTLLSIGVDPDFQGKGIGQELLTRFVREMNSRGAPEIRLSVRGTNSRALAFYAKCGWRLLGEGGEGSYRYSFLVQDTENMDHPAIMAEGELES